MESAPSGSTPKTWQRGRASLTAVATPAQRPPPPIGTITASRSGACAAELEPERGGAEGRERAFEGVDEGAALRGLDLAHALERPVHVLDQIDLGAPPPAGGHAGGVGRPRHHDLRGRAEDPGRVADGDGVVARAHRGDPAGERGAVERQHDGQRAPRLERARVLEELELEDDPGARVQVVGDLAAAPPPHGRLDDQVAEPLPGGADLGERRRGHVRPHLTGDAAGDRGRRQRHPVVAPVVGRLGRPPAREEPGLRLPDLDAERPADLDRVAGPRAPQRDGEVAAGAGRDRAEEVDLGEDLEEVALLRRTGLHEVAVVLKPGHLEDVEHVVDVQLGEPPRRDRPDQVRVAAEVELLSRQELGDVGIAARSEEVVAAPAVGIDPVLERVVRDRRHRTQIGERRPEAIVGRDVSPMKLLRPRCPEALARVVEVPGVEVRHLGTLDGDDPAQLAGADGPRASRPDRYHEAVDEGPRGGLAGEAVVEGAVHDEGAARGRGEIGPGSRHRRPPGQSVRAPL